MIDKLKPERIKKINLESLSGLILEQEFRNYFLEKPGKEHYNLLAYISTLYNGETFLDIGTYKGCSAIALSYNPQNKVISFDISEGLIKLSKQPVNVEFRVDNILDLKNQELLLTSPVILLDTAHDGPFEHEFYNYLLEIGYTGILLLDDIHLNNSMREFWESISIEKYDISNIGHVTGTGLVYFK
jgi:hypothetical protein